MHSPFKIRACVRRCWHQSYTPVTECMCRDSRAVFVLCPNRLQISRQPRLYAPHRPPRSAITADGRAFLHTPTCTCARTSVRRGQRHTHSPPGLPAFSHQHRLAVHRPATYAVTFVPQLERTVRLIREHKSMWINNIAVHAQFCLCSQLIWHYKTGE